MSSLVLYFSRAGENYVSGELRMLKTGNTETVARIIAGLLACPSFRLDPVTPYATDYNTAIAEAQAGKDRQALPPLVALPDLTGVSDVYLGYPIYWGTFPRVVATALESLSWAGKIIHPFATHEGSAFGSSLTDLARLAPEAKIAPGLALHGSRLSSAEMQVRRWLASAIAA